MNNAYLPDLATLLQAGIDPKTGLPVKMTGPCLTGLKEDIARLFSVVDRQDAVKRFKWENLPNGLTGELIERILYFKGQCIFFRMKSDDKFYVLPYTLSGSIDCYGRFMAVTPLPFAGGKTDADKPWINGLIKVPVYNLDDDIDEDDACVIIRDYAPAIEQTIIPRSIMHRPVVELEAECIPFLRTALLNSTGVQGIRVGDEESSANVLAASRAIDEAAVRGQKYVPIVSGINFQDLTSGAPSRASEFLMCMQSLDNIRLQMFGIKNGGIFTKKEHVLQEEQDLNTGSDSITLTDALEQRQSACEKINNVFGLDISVSISADYNEEPMVGTEEDTEDYISEEVKFDVLS